MIASKKNGKLRFPIDYIKLNVMTARDTYPLPSMNECIDSLEDAAIFFTVNCNKVYWKTETPEEDSDKTIFPATMGYSD